MVNYFEQGKKIIRKLEEEGFKAFFVGGFVRDYLLGIKAKDIDITTDALPEEIENVFEKTRATGKRYGTISVFINDMQFEVTTFRADMKYIDYRHPERVVFSKRIEEDLKRRDFTINAFAMDEKEKIIDLFKGKTDLKNKIIRAIGEPDIRFQEDALRILRAFRFVSKLGFDIEEKTLESIKKNIRLLSRISNERIIVEIKEIFTNKHYEKAIVLMCQAGLKFAFPELEAGLETLSSKKNYSINYLQFFAICFFLADCEIPQYWRFSNKETDTIIKLVKTLKLSIKSDFDEMSVYRYGKHLLENANEINILLNLNKDQKNYIDHTYENLPIYSKSELVFDGNDLLKLVQNDDRKIIGEILDELVVQVVKGNIKNDYNMLKKHAIKLLERYDER